MEAEIMQVPAEHATSGMCQICWDGTTVVVEPKPGDLIEIFRVGYQHWAIYVGDGYVIHLAPSNKADLSSTMSVLKEKGIVKKEKLLDVAGGDEYSISNHLDDEYEPRNVSDILSDARSWVGQKIPYSLILRNCEHFVTKLRYGQSKSQQVIDRGICTAVTACMISCVIAFSGICRRYRRAGYNSSASEMKLDSEGGGSA